MSTHKRSFSSFSLPLFFVEPYNLSTKCEYQQLRTTTMGNNIERKGKRKGEKKSTRNNSIYHCIKQKDYVGFLVFFTHKESYCFGFGECAKLRWEPIDNEYPFPPRDDIHQIYVLRLLHLCASTSKKRGKNLQTIDL